MSEKLKMTKKPASEDELKLYLLVGKALCSLQLLEDELIMAIAVNECDDPSNTKRSSEVLKKHRDYGFGKALSVIRDRNLLTELIRDKLRPLKEERDWLVHRGIYQSLNGSPDQMSFDHCKTELFDRLQKIIDETHTVQHLMLEDLISSMKASGKDVSVLIDARERYYDEAN